MSFFVCFMCCLFSASFAWWIFLWAYCHGSTFSCLQVGRRKKGILSKFPATVTHRQCCNFVISIIVAHDADVSLCVHVFLSYQFYCHLIAHVLLENSSLCTFAICCHTNWLAFSPKIIATERCVYSARPWHCRPPHSQRCLLTSLILRRAFGVLGTLLSFRATCRQV